jgi:FkbM family methyltransferase
LIVFDLRAALQDFNAGGQRSRQLAEAFFGTSSEVRRYLLGRNPHALSCTEWARIDGIVDDFADEGATWQGYPVIHADDLPSGAIVVNCSMSIRPLSAHARLASIAGVEVLSYADLIRANPAFPLPDFVASFRSDYALHQEEWRFLESCLADPESRSVLTKLMLYRLTADYAHMSGFSVRFSEQYFDPVVALSASETFVDCGGYDGDTSLEFLARTSDHRMIYLFEPSPPNFEKARARLRGREKLQLYPLGVSDAKGRLSFDPGSGSASSVCSAGSATIDVVSIDEHLAGPVTYIKMDLEGWELNALRGASRHILEDHPKMAVSVYHQSSDFWRIPKYVLGLRDDYDVYLRHYSEGWSETVMYFIPRPAGTHRLPSDRNEVDGARPLDVEGNNSAEPMFRFVAFARDQRSTSRSIRGSVQSRTPAAVVGMRIRRRSLHV